jgi:signal transduction histidine kinase
MVGLLRDVGDLPGLAELDNLLDNARRSGLDLRVVRAGSVEGLSAEASHAAYRIVQEALTNVLRHGADGPVEISLRVAENLVIRVHNSCPASTAHGPDGVAATDALPGNGIRGMQERASAVGGTVRVGPGRAMGWSVEADLPVGAGP